MLTIDIERLDKNTQRAIREYLDAIEVDYEQGSAYRAYLKEVTEESIWSLDADDKYMTGAIDYILQKSDRGHIEDSDMYETVGEAVYIYIITMQTIDSVEFDELVDLVDNYENMEPINIFGQYRDYQSENFRITIFDGEVRDCIRVGVGNLDVDLLRKVL